MIDAGSEVSIRRQCELLGFNRANYYYDVKVKTDREDELLEMNKVVEQYIETPFYGYRKTAKVLNLSEKKVRRLRKKLNLETLYTKPKLSIGNIEHKKYPYLLHDLEIKKVNQVWESDITYIKLKKGSVYLTAIKDVYSRKLLSWELSNTLDTSFCLTTLQRAIKNYGMPEIFNTDQGSQYTSMLFTNELKKNGITISMDGKGRALDNIYIERFWRSLKYENIYLSSYETIIELEAGIDKYINFFNKKRIHQSLNYVTPDSVYYKEKGLKECA